jgi:hypothetical protein
MAIRTRSPSRGWSSVSPYSNYTNVVANYAASLAAAMQNQKNTEIENKVLDYKNGNLSYSDLVSFLNTKLAAEKAGSTGELNIRNVMLDLETYERTQQVNIARAKLTSKYSKNGISASEQRKIEEAVLEKLKKGSAEYTQQLAAISTARELERVEKNNAEVANLQATLSMGGLNTGEQIQVYKKMAEYAEPGSQEKADIETKIGSLAEQKRKEDQEAQMYQKVSQMLDQYEGGGITNEEALSMNREMQKYVDPGSADMVELKQKEANILGDIANPPEGSRDKSFEQEVAVQTAQLKDLEAKFAAGQLNPEEYIQKQEAVMSLIAPQDIPEGNFNIEDMATLKQRFADFESMKQAVQSGQVVPVKVGNQQTLVPLSELTSFKYSEEVPITELDPATGQPAVGNEKTGRVVTLINPDGSERLVSINQDNTFSDVTATKSTKLNADYTTSTVTSYVKSPDKSSSVADFVGTVKKTGPTSAISASTANISQKAAKTVGDFQGSTLNTAKNTVQKAVKSISPTVVSSVKSGVGSAVGSLFGPVGSAVGSYVSSNVPKVSSTVGSLFNKAKSTASNLWGSFTNLFK